MPDPAWHLDWGFVLTTWVPPRKCLLYHAQNHLADFGFLNMLGYLQEKYLVMLNIPLSRTKPSSWFWRVEIFTQKLSSECVIPLWRTKSSLLIFGFLTLVRYLFDIKAGATSSQSRKDSVGDDSPGRRDRLVLPALRCARPAAIPTTQTAPQVGTELHGRDRPPSSSTNPRSPRGSHLDRQVGLHWGSPAESWWEQLPPLCYNKQAILLGEQAARLGSI